jgi:hypothetical protein
LKSAQKTHKYRGARAAKLEEDISTAGLSIYPTPVTCHKNGGKTLQASCRAIYFSEPRENTYISEIEK